MTITWQDPPPIAGPRHPQAIYIEILRRVLERPGEWALIRSGSVDAMHGAAQRLRLRQYHVPPGLWEFSVRSFRRGVHVGRGGTANLYARYLGDEAQHDSPYISQSAVFDEEGRRVCPRCGTSLVKPSKLGPWPRFCETCSSGEGHRHEPQTH